jgi:ferrochelatase
VLYDLDHQAQQQVSHLDGFVAKRAATVGTDPQFVAMLRDLVVERLTGRSCRRTARWPRTTAAPSAAARRPPRR